MTKEQLSKILLNLEAARNGEVRIVLSDMAQIVGVPLRDVHHIVKTLMIDTVIEAEEPEEIYRIAATFLTFVEDKELTSGWFVEAIDELPYYKQIKVSTLEACRRTLSNPPPDVNTRIQKLTDKLAGELVTKPYMSDQRYKSGFRSYCEAIVREILRKVSSGEKPIYKTELDFNAINLIIDRSQKMSLHSGNGYFYASKHLLIRIQDTVTDQRIKHAQENSRLYNLFCPPDSADIIEPDDFFIIDKALTESGFLAVGNTGSKTNSLTYVLPGLFPVEICIQFKQMKETRNIFVVG